MSTPGVTPSTSSGSDQGGQNSPGWVRWIPFIPVTLAVGVVACACAILWSFAPG